MSSWRTWRRGAVVTLTVCRFGLCPVPADAQTLPCTKVFALDDSGSWHADENWVPHGIPGPTDVACILEGGDYQVAAELPVTVAGLEISGPDDNPILVIEGTAFTLNGPGLVSGAAGLKVEDGAELRSDEGGAVDVRSKLKIEASTISLDLELHGELKVEGASSLNGNLKTYPGSSIVIEGTVGGWLTIANGFENRGELVLGNGGTQGITVVSGPLVNAVDGTITVRATEGTSCTPPELRAEIVNRGLLDVGGPGLRIAADGASHSNQIGGSVDVSGAELVIDLGGVAEAASNFTNYGSITVATGGTIRVGGTTQLIEAASNFTNYGSITVATGGTIRVGGSSQELAALGLSNRGFLTILGGGLVVVDGADFENLVGGTVSGDGQFDVANAASVVYNGVLSPGQPIGLFTIHGSVTLGSQATVEIDAGGVNPGVDLDRLDVGGTLGAGGTLEVSLDPPYHPSVGDRHRILTFNQLDGWFDQVSLPLLQSLLAWSVDVGANDLELDVICMGTQLSIDQSASADPVSVGYDLVFEAAVTNASAVSATDLVVTDWLPAELMFRPDLSSPECVLIGGTVECTISGLAPGAVWQPLIGVETVATGIVTNTVLVEAWECDTDPGDNQAAISVEVVAAEPCDANYDLAVDSDDLEPSVAHIFGHDAPGNPDCRLGDGITADDLSAIVVESNEH